jgi:PAS domain S-box-containing protein
MQGNEEALNLNILDSQYHKKEIYNSINTKKIYFAGPLKLKQGGMGILGWLPVYKDNKFWGFTTAIIKLENLLKTSGNSFIDHAEYEFLFSNIHPKTNQEEFYCSTRKNITETNYISKKIPNSNWKIYLIEKNHSNLYLPLLVLGTLGLLIGISIGLFTMRLMKTPEKLRVLLKDQETKLLKNELKFKTVFDQATIGFAIIDACSSEFREVNNKYCEMLGYTFDEIKEKGVAKLTHPDDIESSLLNLKNLEEGKIKEYSAEKRYITKSGKIIWVNLNVSPLWENHEKPTAYIAFIKDITQKKEAEVLIAKSQSRFKSLIDTIDGIVWEYNIETSSSTFISKKVEKILGYTVDDYMENPTFWEDHIYPEDREFALAISTIVNKKYINHDYEYRMITKKGKVIWIRDIVNFVFENGKPVISRGIMIDITIMKEAEKDLSNSFHLVSEQNKRLLNFSYIVSHNLRSHTSNIESIISLIESVESEDERNEMMKLLKSVSNSLDETMYHLNEVVNINSNISLVIKPLNLNHYINKTIDLLSEQIQLNEASFIINVSDDAIINYNSAYLESILFNLISNAIRYKHPQRKPIITIKLYKKRDKDVIEISDNGIGIDLEKHNDKIFGMYKTFSNNSDARGIGLFITKNQIDAMGGTIKVESKPNIGTTFKIYTK